MISNFIGLMLCEFISAPLSNVALAAPPRFRVAGYLPDYRLAQFDGRAAQGLTDLIVFSAELASDGGLDMSRLKQCPWEKLQQFKSQHQVRLHLAIGGWDRSTHFPTVTASDEKRAHCVASILHTLDQYQLDGVDFDWEHPRNATEERAYAVLLQEVRRAIAPRQRTLTVTMASWQRLPASVFAFVDGVQIMAYDHDQRHSTFESCRDDVRKLIDAGAPAGKIILGLPFYGRHVTTREAMTYGEIRAKFGPRPEVDEVEQYYFNGSATIRRKVEFAVQSKLGGIMVWEIGQDAPGAESLLKVIRETLR